MRIVYNVIIPIELKLKDDCNINTIIKSLNDNPLDEPNISEEDGFIECYPLFECQEYIPPADENSSVKVYDNNNKLIFQNYNDSNKLFHNKVNKINKEYKILCNKANQFTLDFLTNKYSDLYYVNKITNSLELQGCYINEYYSLLDSFIHILETNNNINSNNSNNSNNNKNKK